MHLTDFEPLTRVSTVLFDNRVDRVQCLNNFKLNMSSERGLTIKDSNFEIPQSQ